MNKKILVVDDDLAILEVIKLILEEQGYKVIVTSDGGKVQQKINEDFPDLILLDFWLSGQDGRKIAKYLKTQETTRNIPIVMISANHEPEKIARDVDANDFLAKPFDIDDLVMIVKKYTE
ncbi:MAG: response regulator [Candidatus Levybacteria bacterium]|nr:response regulator [Candidatus Levybacteria bacterium]